MDGWDREEPSLRVALSTWRSRWLRAASRALTWLCVSPRFVQGSAAPSAYVFYHWQYIDIFVYFSHHMVTVPPVGWTNTAHRHGVCVLGKSQGSVPGPARLLSASTR